MVNNNDNKVYLNEHLGSVNRNQLLPNFFFFGVSKCGTSTMAKLLTEHPLITAVGSDKGVDNEVGTKFFGNKKFTKEEILRINHIKTDRVAKHLQSINDTLITEILKRGIVMDYTPNNAQNKLALKHMVNLMKFSNRSEEEKQNYKFLLMIRNPLTRTQSSWWFKERDPPKGTIASFGQYVQHGIKQERILRRCFTTYGFNFSDVVKSNDDINRMLGSPVLERCGLDIMNKGRFDERRQHIGKSLYAFTLVWYLKYNTIVLLLNNCVSSSTTC